jgi:hypothetical protein
LMASTSSIYLKGRVPIRAMMYGHYVWHQGA